MSNAIPIVMYHQVAPRALPNFGKYTVTPDAFAAQMRWLKITGYHPIDFNRLVAYRRGEATLPAKPIVITFDDGFQDCVDHAVPVLQARGFTAIFYLVAGLMGKPSRWLRSERGIELPLIDWEAARGLRSAGFQCGAHTMSHPHLSRLSVDQCCHELQMSRRLLEDQLGHEVRHLAYPFGSFNDTVRAAAAETGYATACTTEIGIARAGDDLLTLCRIPVSGFDSLLDFVGRLYLAQTPREFVRERRWRMGEQLRERGLSLWL